MWQMDFAGVDLSCPQSFYKNECATILVENDVTVTSKVKSNNTKNHWTSFHCINKIIINLSVSLDSMIQLNIKF